MKFWSRFENHLYGRVGASPAPTNEFLGAGGEVTRPYKMLLYIGDLEIFSSSVREAT